MREAVMVILKKLPTGMLNALLLVALSAVVYFAYEERTATLTEVKEQRAWDQQQDEHFNKLDQQLASLATTVGSLVDLEKQSRERNDQRRAEQVRMAEQLGRAIALVEAHVEASHGAVMKPAVQ